MSSGVFPLDILFKYTMANEFVARKGLIVSGSTQLTGSLTVSNGITGSLFGTASWATNAVTASLLLGSVVSASFASTASFVNILNQNVSASGNIAAGVNLISNFSAGDEGGEIQLARPQTNTSISGSVVIDVYQNKVRLYEATSPNRGGYWDITSLASGVGTNLAAIGGGGTVTSITAGSGLTGATISSAGTITLDTSSAHFITGSISVLNARNVVSSSTQINTGSFSGSITTASYANNADLLDGLNSTVFATTGSNSFVGNQLITGSLRVSGSTILTGSTILSSSVQIVQGTATLTISNTSTGVTAITQNNGEVSIVGYNFLGGGGFRPDSTDIRDLGSTSFRWRQAHAASIFANNIFASGSITNTGSISILSGSISVINGGITGSLIGTSSWATNATIASTASYFDGFITFPSGLDITGSLVVSGSQTLTGNLQIISGAISSSGPQHGILLQSGSNTLSVTYPAGGSAGNNWLYRSANAAHVFRINSTDAIIVDSTSTSPITTNTYALGGVSNRFASAYVNNIFSSGSTTHTGSTDILGNFTATTKSFKIDHQRLPGKSLVYGVLEGPEHAVYVRGRIQSKLTDTATIQLPEDWEWLVDENSITVQLTPINGLQELYVQNIENNTVTIKSKSAIDCFYLVHATRKDVAPLITVE